VLRYHAEQPLVQGIWRAMAAQLAACTDCVNAYHSAQACVWLARELELLLGGRGARCRVLGAATAAAAAAPAASRAVCRAHTAVAAAAAAHVLPPLP